MSYFFIIKHGISFYCTGIMTPCSNIICCSIFIRVFDSVSQLLRSVIQTVPKEILSREVQCSLDVVLTTQWMISLISLPELTSVPHSALWYTRPWCQKTKKSSKTMSNQFMLLPATGNLQLTLDCPVPLVISPTYCFFHLVELYDWMYLGFFSICLDCSQLAPLSWIINL